RWARSSCPLLPRFPMRLAATLALAALMGVPALAAAPQRATPANRPVLIDKHMPQPPPSPRHPASSTFHGVRVNDPYRWLENGQAPAVRKWIREQNTYAEQMLAMMPAGDAIARRVRQLAITST